MTFVLPMQLRQSLSSMGLWHYLIAGKWTPRGQQLGKCLVMKKWVSMSSMVSINYIVLYTRRCCNCSIHCCWHLPDAHSKYCVGPLERKTLTESYSHSAPSQSLLRRLSTGCYLPCRWYASLCSARYLICWRWTATPLPKLGRPRRLGNSPYRLLWPGTLLDERNICIGLMNSAHTWESCICQVVHINKVAS